jgi:hypothetical protein
LLRTARAGPSLFSVGVEQVGDTLPESGQETDWAKQHPPATSINFLEGPPSNTCLGCRKLSRKLAPSGPMLLID